MVDEKTVAAQVASAEKAKAVEDKLLPSMRQPTVSLLEELRLPAAKRAKETGESFSVTCCKLIAKLLADEKRITQDVFGKLDFTTKRGGGGAGASKAVISDLEAEVAALKAKLAKLGQPVA